MTNAAKPVVSLKNVSKSFQLQAQEVKALCGVDLAVLPGMIFSITGKSGSGKSTLLQIIGTLDRPSSGQVYVNGEDTSVFDDKKLSFFRNLNVGFVFQMNNLLPEFSAVENVMLPGLISGGSWGEVRERAEVLLNQVGLGHRFKHRPGQLSGGEQQRVAIARAIIMRPPIILADEPTGNLDKKTGEGIADLLLDVCSKNSTVMMLVTHDLQLAKRLPYQIVMEDGKIISQE